ncbi:hypothetical protein ACEPAG_9119 [Sanghuangporus baumii]
MSNANANFSSSTASRRLGKLWWRQWGSYCTQGSGDYGGGDVQDLSTGDQYGSSGGYLPEGVDNEPRRSTGG